MVDRVEFRRRELDFTSSEQGKHMTTSVVADGTELINALDLIDSEGDPIQTSVCEQCGFQRLCQWRPRFHTAPRWRCLFMPAFEAMADGGSDLATSTARPISSRSAGARSSAVPRSRRWQRASRSSRTRNGGRR